MQPHFEQDRPPRTRSRDLREDNDAASSHKVNLKQLGSERERFRKPGSVVSHNAFQGCMHRIRPILGGREIPGIRGEIKPESMPKEDGDL